MSKIKCVCGNIIVDQTDNLPYKAQFFADEDYEASYEKFIAFCVRLIQAKDEDKLSDFIKQEFGEKYPVEQLSLEDFISDSLTGMRATFGHTMYECEVCGRLWVQYNTHKDTFASYMPEGDLRGILSSDKRKKGGD